MDKALIDNDGSQKDEEAPIQPTPQERQIVNRCLQAVSARAKALEIKGLSTTNFCLGVSNSLFVAWSFGAIPQHFWIVYLLEVSVLFPIRWIHQVRARPLKEQFYWCDFCWYANFVGVLTLFTLAVDQYIGVISDDIREALFCVSWGVGCGPLLLATGLVGNALVFHDADQVASCLIHLFPALVMYTIGWHHDKLHAAWPLLFHVDYLDKVRPFSDIYVKATLMYALWWVFYTCWLTTCAMDFPKKGYDTIFHANMRGGLGKFVAQVNKTPKEEHEINVRYNNFSKKDALVYMVAHALASNLAILVSLLCYLTMYCHILLCGTMTFVTIYNAARRYNYYMIQSYGDAVRKELGIPFGRMASALEA